MRQRILTEHERKILEAYVKEGMKLDGFSVLRLRSQRLEAKLREELNLVQAALKRVDEEEKCAGKR